jgi:ABC-type branched-subunit amino acid transport system permease subunit
MATDTIRQRLTGDSEFDRVGERTRWLASLGLAVFVLTVAFLLSDLVVSVPDESLLFLETGIKWGIYGLLVLGLNVQFGNTGLVNFGYLVFFMLGGYTFALVTSDAAAFGGLGLAWPVGVVAVLVAVIVLGLAFGVMALRLRDDFLAIVTLAALLVGIELIESFDGVTGGTNGIYGIPQLIDGLAGTYHNKMVTTFLLVVSFVLVGYAVSQRLTEGPYGRVLRSIRSDELVSQTLGKQTFRYKVQAFLFGAVIAGIAGILLATHQGSITPDFFGLHITIIVWVGMLLGGSGNNRSVLAGLAIILGLNLSLQFAAGGVTDALPNVRFGAISQMVVGLVLVLVMRYRPEGIWGDPEELEVHE